MSKRVITIGRQYGSNGRVIAQMLSEKLGIHFYDKDLIRLAAEKADISYEDLLKVDERRANPWRYPVENDAQMNRRFRYEPMNDVLFETERQVILELANREDCIIVGRCANHILRDVETVRNVFLYAPVSARIARIAERTGLDERSAAALIKKIDRQRMYYYSTYTDHTWDDLAQYHLAVDTAANTQDAVLQIMSCLFETIGS